MVVPNRRVVEISFVETPSIGRQVEVSQKVVRPKEPTPVRTQPSLPLAEEDQEEASVSDPATDGGLHTDSEDDLLVMHAVKYAKTTPQTQSRMVAPTLKLASGKSKAKPKGSASRSGL